MLKDISASSFIPGIIVARIIVTRITLKDPVSIGCFPKGDAPEVNVHDFVDKELGKAVPYGVFDIAKNEGWVSVGISKDTGTFAVNIIRNW